MLPIINASPSPVNDSLRAKSKQTGRFGYKIVLFLWFLFLFEPARLIAYYIPPLEPLKWLPTILLIAASFHWLTSPLKKHNYKWFTYFLIVNLFGTVIAFWGGNWGIARQINRQIFQFYMLGILSFTFLNDDEKSGKLFHLYFFHILYFAAWGILSLKLFPLDPLVDPGKREIVPWHHWLSNRDAFGPLMVIGLAYCFYYYKAIGNKKIKWISLICAILCLGGIILSFGKGVFLAMGLTIVYIWLQSKRKLSGMALMILVGGMIFLIVSIISPEGTYWEGIKTIEHGTSVGTGADRKILWGIAWKEFINYPVFGVGTGNFGIAALKLIPEDEALRLGYTYGRLWGRSVHCAPLTILSEYGLVGSLVFIFMIIDFIKTNLMSRRFSLEIMNKKNQTGMDKIPNFPSKIFSPLSMGLMACFVAFWGNGIFYEIIYAPFFWNLIVMNRLIYVNLSEMKKRISPNLGMVNKAPLAHSAPWKRTEIK